MTAEVWDLAVDHHRSPMVTVADGEGRLIKLPECPPPGTGWIWEGISIEEDFEIGHWIRRQAVKRD